VPLPVGWHLIGRIGLTVAPGAKSSHDSTIMDTVEAVCASGGYIMILHSLSSSGECILKLYIHCGAVIILRQGIINKKWREASLGRLVKMKELFICDDNATFCHKNVQTII